MFGYSTYSTTIQPIIAYNMFTGDVLSSPQSSSCKDLIKGAFINILNDLCEVNFVVFIYFWDVTSLFVFIKKTHKWETHTGRQCEK